MLAKNIALIGFMGSGKSTVGRLLADSLGANFVDSDEEIKKVAGMAVSEIFEKLGEPHFRKLESEMVCRLSTMPNLVISTGGGVVINPENIKILKDNYVVVFLSVSAEEIALRLADDETRPLLAGGDKLQKIKDRLQVRLPLYISAADVIVYCDGNTAEENCLGILSKLKMN